MQSPDPLSRDRVVHLLSAALALASIPLITPLLGDEWRATYGHRIIDLPFLVGIIVSIRFRQQRVQDSAERRFWNLLTIGFAWWLIALGIGAASALIPLEHGVLYTFLKNGPYLVLYGALAAALEIHPHVQDDPVSARLRILDRAGSSILLFGLLSYFLVVPTVASGTVSAFWASSLALFVAFDAYIVLRLWQLQVSAKNREWRSVYRWLLIGAASWGTGDLLLLLMYEGLIPDPGWGTLFDLIWPVSFSAVIVATRSRIPGNEAELPTAPTYKPFGMGPLVVYTLTPLLMHVTLYRFGLPGSEFSALREDLALGLTAILAGLTLVYHQLLRFENARLAEAEARAREELSHQAFHDELTGLPNRNMFRDRLHQAIAESVRYRGKCAVLFCDLDQFKVINDSLGHEAGDETLVATAERLRELLRKQDTVARLGGDEFAVVVQRVQRAPDVAVLAEKMLATISEPLMVGRKHHVLTASIGVAVFPDDGVDEHTLLKHADTAMYQSKLHGRNTYRLFTEAMNEAAEERLAIEQGLRTGLLEDRFTVFYQPIVELADSQPVGYEALLRWNHPQRGYISPFSFIDVAEQTGLIEPIGQWVLETSCTWAAQPRPAGEAPAYVSVNVSPRQFRDPELASEVARVLQDSGLEAERLQLEITESMALTIDSTAPTLRTLRDMGVRIAIDDFGTGYAALSLLQDLAVDVVKIDQAFVRGIKTGSVSEAIIRAIVSMARALDFYVVAEGVETGKELAVIRECDCDAVQGFYLCKPLPPDELEEALRRNP
jgi:diguanylate cyclase (GGDEF)-like protein